MLRSPLSTDSQWMETYVDDLAVVIRGPPSLRKAQVALLLLSWFDRVHLGAVHLGRVDSRGLRPRWCCTTVGAAKLSGQRRDNQSQRRDIQAHPSAHVTPAQLGPSLCRTPLPTPLMLGIAPSG